MVHIETQYEVCIHDLKNNISKSRYMVKNRGEAQGKMREIIKKHEKNKYVCSSISEKTVICKKQRATSTSIIKIFYKKIKGTQSDT